MDREQLITRLDRRYVSKREIINRIPLGITADEVWRDLLNRRRSRSTSLPICTARGSLFWYVTTDKMITDSEKIVEELMANEADLNPYTDAPAICPLKEVFFTSYVEGASISMQEAMLFLQSDSPPRDVEEQMILNNRLAGGFISSNLYRPIDENYLRNLAYILTDGMDNGGPDFRSADYSDVPFMMGESFELPTASTLPDRLREITALLRSPDIHPLIKAGVAQAWVLIMRPFPEGNDRLARLLSEAILLQAGYTFFSDVSISSLIAKNTFSYYAAAANVFRTENGGDMTYFLEYYIGLLALAVDERRLVAEHEDEQLLDAQRLLARTPLRPPENTASTPDASCGEDMDIQSLDGFEVMSVDSKPDEHDAALDSDIIRRLEEIMNGPGLILPQCAALLKQRICNGTQVVTIDDFLSEMSIGRKQASSAMQQFKEKGIVRRLNGNQRPAAYRFNTDTVPVVIPPVKQPSSVLDQLQEIASGKARVLSKCAGVLVDYLNDGTGSFSCKDLVAPTSLTPRQISSGLHQLEERGLIHNSQPKGLLGVYTFCIDPVMEEASVSGEVADMIKSLAASTSSHRDRRIGSILSSCLRKGCVSFSDYKDAGEMTKWISDMTLASQMGLVERVSNSEYRILDSINPQFSLLRKSQRETATAMYESFGDESFTLEMVVATLDYSSTHASAYLHQFTLLKILDCRKDDVNTYQFLVNPEEHPECFVSVA
ncbi:MAG: Fic family protein [Oscillospiraceae bacterium]|nr:Fic family protein [Oscillospiraceae bacterium]